MDPYARALLSWWQAHGRRDPQQKPWMVTADQTWPRPDEVLSPYGIWIAEVMLQQTQLQVVLPYWTRWMERFPRFEDLAEAEEQAVLLSWQGLGYYSRARRLKVAAGVLMAMGAGGAEPRGWPSDLEPWLALPGIGRSTAGGILSSAFNSPLAILDGNVRRVLARLQAHPTPPMRAQAQFWLWSEALIAAAPGRARDCNQALMDLGATLCTPRNPSCPRCPWRDHCAAYAAGTPEAYPVTDAPRSLPFSVIGVGVVLNQAGEVLIDQRLNEGLLGGLWEFPGGKQEPGEAITDTIARELQEELAIDVAVDQELITVDHAYSHKKLRFIVHLCRWLSGEPQPLASQQVRWVKPEELGNFPFPAANARIIEALLKSLG
ncbi:8-oxo-dGTP diphosphatase MutT [Synechococcus sp. CS-197]|uniref:8-oxo-dGTP diphosphatase MutT n=1 Tax=Synechococcus sp. CS-197 TaxID=2847985 RepID=UPI000152517E|nr:8-oxo-dGTP diphosphatase MutT [Synechococcus sp. CS-197]MCT0250429.1 8-oxo-dGTP diphosphatase MutT [Synechococcus sp. CS-197]CAK22589.1 A/G-specific DNA glycosylase MutY [Synechococcus sp. WH 7803]